MCTWVVQPESHRTHRATLSKRISIHRHPLVNQLCRLPSSFPAKRLIRNSSLWNMVARRLHRLVHLHRVHLLVHRPNLELLLHPLHRSLNLSRRRVKLLNQLRLERHSAHRVCRQQQLSHLLQYPRLKRNRLLLPLWPNLHRWSSKRRMDMRDPTRWTRLCSEKRLMISRCVYAASLHRDIFAEEHTGTIIGTRLFDS